jgi:hypothetical protein
MNKNEQLIFLIGMCEGMISTALAVYFKGQGVKQFFSIMACYVVFRVLADLVGGRK